MSIIHHQLLKRLLCQRVKKSRYQYGLKEYRVDLLMTSYSADIVEHIELNFLRGHSCTMQWPILLYKAVCLLKLN
ncbi:hypothetical protein B0O80DRAFT_463288 [Mortierella sp. GBAus27b]|nr:hypothetical protein B0O80DRAFT_463288 [Mortierella sp. GBAus27b]